MNRFAPPSLAVLILFVLIEPVAAQPDLSSLWPVELDRAWTFDVRAEVSNGGLKTGAITYTVAEYSALTSEVSASCFDVASTMSGQWARPTVLLAVPPCWANSRVQVDNAAGLGTWSDSLGDWEWMWLPADVAPGSAFRLQTRTQVSDDSFINGEVRTIAGTVTTPAGSFNNAVIVDYVFEWGVSEVTDFPGGTVIGTISAETLGWIAFVPGVGPAALEETIVRTAIDCAHCPPEIFEPITTELKLQSTTSVAVEPQSFGSLKARF